MPTNGPASRVAGAVALRPAVTPTSANQHESHILCRAGLMVPISGNGTKSDDLLQVRKNITGTIKLPGWSKPQCGLALRALASLA